jgi:hypothetical protein
MSEQPHADPDPPDDGPCSEVSDRPEPSSPLTFPPLLTWHGVNWQPLRRDLELSGDEDGLARLDARLPRLRDKQHSIREEVIDGKVVEVYSTGWCAASLLDWFRDRRSAQWMLSELAPALQVDASTPVGVCERWSALASWVTRLTRGDDGQGLLGFGEDAREDRKIGGVPSPSRTWASAFREATAAVLPLMRGREDVAVHRLLQDLDDVLQGRDVYVGKHLREVDVLVRAALARAKTAMASQKKPQPKGNKMPAIGRTERWVLNVLRKQPDRAFKLKDLLAAREPGTAAPCPVARTGLCDALMLLRERSAVVYERRSYMHKPKATD